VVVFAVAKVTEAAVTDAAADALLLSSRKRRTSLAKRFLLCNEMRWGGGEGEKETKNITPGVPNIMVGS
jgi:hypothetical protein